MAGLCEIDLNNLFTEISIHSQLEHPNIIGFYGSLQNGNMLYLLLEYAKGNSLYFYVNDTMGLPEEISLRFFYSTVQALKKVHEKNIIHRDIKPENILLDEDFNVKLCDFGWAVQVVEKDDFLCAICGTFDYISPEIMRGDFHSFETDVWSLGILLLELVTGSTPYRADSIEEIRHEFNTKPIQLTMKISPKIRALIKAMLRVRPEDRISLDGILAHEAFDEYRESFSRPLDPVHAELLRISYEHNKSLYRPSLLQRQDNIQYDTEPEFSPENLLANIEHLIYKGEFNSDFGFNHNDHMITESEQHYQDFQNQNGFEENVDSHIPAELPPDKQDLFKTIEHLIYKGEFDRDLLEDPQPEALLCENVQQVPTLVENEQAAREVSSKANNFNENSMDVLLMRKKEIEEERANINLRINELLLNANKKAEEETPVVLPLPLIPQVNSLNSNQSFTLENTKLQQQKFQNINSTVEPNQQSQSHYKAVSKPIEAQTEKKSAVRTPFLSAQKTQKSSNTQIPKRFPFRPKEMMKRRSRTPIKQEPLNFSPAKRPSAREELKSNSPFLLALPQKGDKSSSSSVQNTLISLSDYPNSRNRKFLAQDDPVREQQSCNWLQIKKEEAQTTQVSVSPRETLQSSSNTQIERSKTKTSGFETSKRVQAKNAISDARTKLANLFPIHPERNSGKHPNKTRKIHLNEVLQKALQRQASPQFQRSVSGSSLTLTKSNTQSNLHSKQNSSHSQFLTINKRFNLPLIQINEEGVGILVKGTLKSSCKPTPSKEALNQKQAHFDTKCLSSRHSSALNSAKKSHPLSFSNN